MWGEGIVDAQCLAANNGNNRLGTKESIYSHNGSGAAPYCSRVCGGARERNWYFSSLFFFLLCQTGVRVAKKEKKRGKVSPGQLFDGQINVEGREGGRLRLIFGLVGM